MAAKLRAPVDVQIELTQACNWRCCHCYNYWRLFGAAIKPNQHISRDGLRHIVQELVINQVPSITITGGEPFARRSDVFVLLEMVQKAGIRASLNTNLSLVEEEDIEKLASKYSNVPILISLLSADAEEHERLAGAPSGTHTLVTKYAMLAVRRGLSVGLNMVLMRENLSAIEATAHLAKKLGMRTFCVTKALPNTHVPDGTFLLSAEEVRWSLVELMRIEKLLNIPVDILGCYPRCLFVDTPAYQRFSHRTCVAGYTTVTIGADGEVRPCSHMEMSYGNIFREPLTGIWQKMDGWREGEFIPEQCRGCPIVTACRGGCRVNTLTPSLCNVDIHADPKHLSSIPRESWIPCVPQEVSVIPSEVMVHPQVKFRDESFGALLYRSDCQAIVLVNRSAATFLKKAAEDRKVFSFLAFLEHSGAITEAERQIVERLYRKLVQKGLLITPTEQDSQRFGIRFTNS